MVAPETWSTPSGSATGHSGPQLVDHAGDYWFVTDYDTATPDHWLIRYSSLASGSWATVADLAADGNNLGPYESMRVSYDGTYYAALVPNPTGTSYIAYTTDPTGSWSTATHGSAIYAGASMEYTGSEWVMTGANTSTNHPMIGTASDFLGTWTYDSTDAGAGGTGGSAATRGFYIAYGGGYYVLGIYTAGAYRVKYATSPTGPWTECALTGFTFGNPEAFHQFRYIDSLALWVGIAYNTSATEYEFVYGSAPDSWTAVSSASVPITDIYSLMYGNGYWVATGRSGTLRAQMAYLRAETPTGTYTSISPTGYASTSNLYPNSVDFHDGRFVVAARLTGEIRYSNYVAPPGPTYLRQRQSPVRAPSRVSGLDIRSRQTPIIVR